MPHAACEALASDAAPMGRLPCFRIISKIGSDMEQDDPLDREGGEQARAGDGVDWAQIEHSYIHGDWSLMRIAEAHGSTPTTITAYAKKYGWVRLVGTKSLKRGRRPRLPGAPMSKRATVDQLGRRKIVRRLLEVLDGKMREFEERMAHMQDSGAAPSAADTERDARSLNALARLYAKLVELDEAAKPPSSKDSQGSDKLAATRSDDADQLRRDLALRLERLNRAGDA